MIGIYVVYWEKGTMSDFDKQIIGAFVDKKEAEEFVDKFVETLPWSLVLGTQLDIVITKWHGGTESTSYTYAYATDDYMIVDSEYIDSIKIEWEDGREKSIPAY